MFLPNRLTPSLRVVALVLCLALVGLTFGCNNSAVSDTAVAQPNANPAATPNANPNASPNANPAAAASPTVPGAPALPGQASPAPGQPQFGPDGRAFGVGMTPEYAKSQEEGKPKTTMTPINEKNIRHLEGDKLVYVTGKNLPPEMMGPPPTPTPTPAPTPEVVMENGKIKQKWQAPAEFVSMKSPLKVNGDVVKKGQYLYKNRCEICHGSEGKGNGAYNDPKWTQATNLASKAVQANTDGELFYKISTSRDRHPASKVLYTEEERWMVVAFLRSLK